MKIDHPLKHERLNLRGSAVLLCWELAAPQTPPEACPLDAFIRYAGLKVVAPFPQDGKERGQPATTRFFPSFLARFCRSSANVSMSFPRDSGGVVATPMLAVTAGKVVSFCSHRSVSTDTRIFSAI